MTEEKKDFLSESEEDVEKTDIDTNKKPLTESENSIKKKVPVLLWVLNFVAIAAIVIVFILFNNKINNHQPGSSHSQQPSVDGVRIAFVHVDTLQQDYELAVYYRDSIQKRFKAMENSLTAKKRKWEKKYTNLIKGVQDNILDQSTAQAMEKELAKEQEQLYNLEQDYSTRISEIEFDLNMVYLDSIWSYLNRKKQELGYDIVLGFQKGATNLYFIDESINITRSILEGLNNEYFARYPERKKDSDKAKNSEDK